MTSNLRSSSIGWGERLAIINKFGLSDQQATAAFGVSADELITARDMARSGTFTIPTEFDYAQYEAEIESFRKPASKPPVTAAPEVTPEPEPVEPNEPPATATKPKKEAKKRGRKGTKIIDAFMAVPTEAVPAEDFAKKHNVSLAVLRQAKRFDTTGLKGDVKVKKDRQAGVLMIWRES